MAAVFQAILTRSRVSVDHVDGVMDLGRATLAGSALADLFFLAAYHKLILKFDKLCKGAGLEVIWDSETVPEEIWKPSGKAGGR